MKKIMSATIFVVMIISNVFIFSGCGKSNIDNISKNILEPNAVNSVSTEGQLPDGMVDIKDKNSYYFIINGQKFTTENQLKDIEKAGFVQDNNSAQAEVQKNTFYIGGGYFRDSGTGRTVFSVVPVNNSADSIMCADANIGGFNVDNYYYKDYDGKIEVAGGISIGSTVDELVSSYGDPTEKDMRANYDNLGILYKYKVGIYQYFEFEIDKSDKKITQITWRYFENS